MVLSKNVDAFTLEPLSRVPECERSARSQRANEESNDAPLQPLIKRPQNGRGGIKQRDARHLVENGVVPLDLGV